MMLLKRLGFVVLDRTFGRVGFVGKNIQKSIMIDKAVVYVRDQNTVYKSISCNIDEEVNTG